MSKELKKVTEGLVRDRGKKWFPKLTDKRKVACRSYLYMYTHLFDVHLLGYSMKIHLYWAMKNCESNPSKLEQLIMNIPNHYKVCFVCM